MRARFALCLLASVVVTGALLVHIWTRPIVPATEWSSVVPIMIGSIAAPTLWFWTWVFWTER